jgi:hypothetical protein
MCGLHFCSMKITEDALQQGLKQKAKEFVRKGSEVYAKA